MIVILTQCFPPVRGGIENVMGGLASALKDAGQKLVVLADSSKASREQPDHFSYTVKRFGGLKWLRRQRKRWELPKWEPSAIIADSWKSVQALPPQTIPVIVLAHGMEFPANPRPEKAERIRNALTHATVVVANSHYTAGLVRPYLAEHVPVEIIYPPIAPQEEPSDFMPHEFKDASPKLMSLSRLEPRKGIDMVIRAMPAVVNRYPRAVMVVAGDGADRPRLETLATRLGVGKKVLFLGAIDSAKKATLLSRADLFVMPARREGDSVEGFGLGYIEAAWYGVPAIAGKDGGAPDAVLDGVTGLICDGNDADDVEAKMLQLLADEPLRKKLGNAAQQRARGELQWSAAVQRYLALVNQHRS